MELIINTNEIRNISNKLNENTEKLNNNLNKNIDLNLENKLELSPKVNEYEKILNNIIDKGANYIIKGMPINDSVKNILIDVKEALKSRDFQKILKTAIFSSLKEGLELLKMPLNIIKDLNKLKDITLKGGIRELIINGIDLISKRFLKGNLFEKTIKGFLDDIKVFIRSNKFLEKLESKVLKVCNKSKNFQKLSEEWYLAYEKLDFNNINKVMKKLKSMKSEVIVDDERFSEYKIIENMTMLVNSKKDKLSNLQLQMCRTL